ncbi:hypothetical protein Peur_050847 [Populus x canadensis]
MHAMSHDGHNLTILAKILTVLGSVKLGSKGKRKALRVRMPTKMMTSTRIHCLIEDDEIVFMPRCHDALSVAVCRETLIFSAGFILGYALSADLLGKPDFRLLTYVSYHSPCSFN